MPKPGNILRALGRTSAALRAKRKISIGTLAERSGIDPDRLKRFEQGKVNIDADELTLIAASFGMLASTFVRRAGH